MSKLPLSVNTRGKTPTLWVGRQASEQAYDIPLQYCCKHCHPSAASLSGASGPTTWLRPRLFAS
jgi:hypothetical protein